MSKTLLEKRKERVAEQLAEKQSVQDKIVKLVDELKPYMFNVVHMIEQELIERGKIYKNTEHFMLDAKVPLYKEIRELYDVYREEVEKAFESKLKFKYTSSCDRDYLCEAVATNDYIEGDIASFLETRGIRLEVNRNTRILHDYVLTIIGDE